jgi:hypothetical protein
MKVRVGSLEAEAVSTFAVVKTVRVKMISSLAMI